MKSSEDQKNEIKKFGYLITLITFILYFYSSYEYNHFILLLSIFIFIYTIYRPYKLNFLYKKWMQLAEVIKKITNPIIMLLMYAFLSIIGIVLKICGRDILLLKKGKYKTTWKKVNKKFETESFKNQY